MSHFYFLLIAVIFSCQSAVYSQKKWDGGGGNNAWSNPLNWAGNVAPVSTDHVILDNSIITGNFTVQLPVTAVTVRSVTITPLLNRTIELSLPAVNTLAPGFTATGPGYGLIINSGGIFRNASGASSGTAVIISDSIRINNSGKYIHNTSGGHAANVQLLSSAPGTESGIFELDIPSASSTISLSGRIFGRLSLKSAAAGGACNYTAAGTSKVLIRENLEIGAGVNLNLNFADTIFIAGNFSQEAGTFNVGNAPRSVVIYVRQNFTQSVGGIITETGTGIQTIVMGSENAQLMTVRGTWLNQVALVKSGAGAVLLKSALTLPYKLGLISGKIITSSDWLLTLQPSCILETDSLSDQGFITGPLKKEGLSNSSFLFPVGDGLVKRWLRLEQATGTFTIEHFKVNPETLSAALGTGIHHISSVEYWNVSGSTGATASIKLSFNDPHSGGVTNLSSLRVARLNFTTWQNAGNASNSGSPGSNGWVRSTAASGFSADARSFALASAISQENPLPLFNLSFKVRYENDVLDFRWKLDDSGFQPDMFEIQQSEDGKNFTTCIIVPAFTTKTEYTRTLQSHTASRYYRLRMKNKAERSWYYSDIALINLPPEKLFVLPAGNMASDKLPVVISSKVERDCWLIIYSTDGKKLYVSKVRLSQGKNVLNVNVVNLVPGNYYLQIHVGNDKLIQPFTKR